MIFKYFSWNWISIIYLTLYVPLLAEIDSGALASLTYHVKELNSQLESQIKGIQFSNEEVINLWERVFHSSGKEEQDLETAYLHYYQAKDLISLQKRDEALPHLKQSFLALETLRAQEFSSLLMKHHKPLFSFENYLYIPREARKAMSPYFISYNHPMKQRLDHIFTSKRATLNQTTFAEAGFLTKGSTRSKTFLQIASHPDLPGYLVKAYLDNELRQKHGRPSWLWLARRCEGADIIRHYIDKGNIKHFTVARKWIYPFPNKPSPPQTDNYTKHLALLLVTDMNLAPDNLNYYAWYHYITEDHLDELYYVISKAKGSAYRPDNIAYTQDGTFAFIDTEYPTSGPDYSSIRGFLRPQMLAYWDKLVKHGGPHH